LPGLPGRLSPAAIKIAPRPSRVSNKAETAQRREAFLRQLGYHQGEGIVAALIDDLPGDGALAIERVGGHDRPFQPEHRQ